MSTKSAITFLFPSSDSAHAPINAETRILQAQSNRHSKFIRCIRCGSHICLTDQIISKGFNGRWGRAILVSQHAQPDSHPSPADGAIVNLFEGRPAHRTLVTGLHTISDVFCISCNAYVGWRYLAAEQPSQQYKVGNYILETQRTCNDVHLISNQDKAMESDTVDQVSRVDDRSFDSQDEDELENLFRGETSHAEATANR